MKKIILFILLSCQLSAFDKLHEFDPIPLSNGIINLYSIEPVFEMRQSELVAAIVGRNKLINLTGNNRAVLIQFQDQYFRNFVLVYAQNPRQMSYIILVTASDLTMEDSKIISKVNEFFLGQNWSD